MKYHNTADGPRPCRASKKPCPIGGDHFTDKAAAQKAFENTHEALPKPVERTLPRIVVPVKVTPFANGQYYGCYINKTRINDHRDAMLGELGLPQTTTYEGNKVQRDRGWHYHLTVVAPPEVKEMKKAGKILTPFPEDSDVVFEGLGRATDGDNDAFYIVCSSEKLDAWRAENGLPKKDFHITLGFSRKDVHTKSKGEETIIRR